MNPLLMFSAGILAGVTAVRLLKGEGARRGVEAAEKFAHDTVVAGREKTASGLEAAQEKLRGAAIAGLESVEKSSARLRTKLTPASEVASVEAAAVAEVKERKAPAANAVADAVEATPPAKRAPRRKAAPRTKKPEASAS